MNFHGTASINLFPFHSQPQIFKQNFTSTIRYLKHAKNQKDVDLKSLSRFEILRYVLHDFISTSTSLLTLIYILTSRLKVPDDWL